jgi:hypothetical protein
MHRQYTDINYKHRGLNMYKHTVLEKCCNDVVFLDSCKGARWGLGAGFTSGNKHGRPSSLGHAIQDD